MDGRPTGRQILMGFLSGTIQTTRQLLMPFPAPTGASSYSFSPRSLSFSSWITSTPLFPLPPLFLSSISTLSLRFLSPCMRLSVRLSITIYVSFDSSLCRVVRVPLSGSPAVTYTFLLIGASLFLCAYSKLTFFLNKLHTTSAFPSIQF